MLAASLSLATKYQEEPENMAPVFRLFCVHPRFSGQEEKSSETIRKNQALLRGFIQLFGDSLLNAHEQVTSLDFRDTLPQALRAIAGGVSELPAALSTQEE